MVRPGEIAAGFLPWVVSVDEHSAANPLLSLTVSPNPARDAVKFIINISEAGWAKIHLFSFLGQSSEYKECYFSECGEQDVMLDVSNLTPGIYFYTVSLGAQRASGKLVVE